MRLGIDSAPKLHDSIKLVAHPVPPQNLISGATPMATSANLGFPRVGLKRELKKAQESYWKGTMTQDGLTAIAKDLRARHWTIQKDAGITYIPSGDFTMYDHVLDTLSLIHI